VNFTAPAEHYDRFMGRYVRTLGPAFADAAGIREGMRVLDVGCGPGGLTRELVARTGDAELVAAIDPSPQFAAACRERFPGADVRDGGAEQLPWEDGTFDAALASLVIAFMADADAGIREMARVTRPGGTVALCMWDVPGGGMTMLSTFWAAVRAVDPAAEGENVRAGMRDGDIAERLRRAGLDDVEQTVLVASTEYAGFDDFWEPFGYGVGPAGSYLAQADDERREAIREELRRRLGKSDGPFSLDARAWCARGVVPG
jgi:ubiquinone/menaquinone biosynthesis C-methylase UbiE